MSISFEDGVTFKNAIQGQDVNNSHYELALELNETCTTLFRDYFSIDLKLSKKGQQEWSCKPSDLGQRLIVFRLFGNFGYTCQINRLNFKVRVSEQRWHLKKFFFVNSMVIIFCF